MQIPVAHRILLLERFLLLNKEETLQALVRGWMGLAQLNNKTWPRAKDVSSLASHLEAEGASIDWTRIHQWVQDGVPVPDEQPPAGVEARHWGIDRALYGLIKNRRATLASLEETLRGVDERTDSPDEDDPMDEDPDAHGSPSPSQSPSPSGDGDDHTPPPGGHRVVDAGQPRHLPDPPASPRALSSASRSRTIDGDDGAPHTLEVISKAPTAPTVSDMVVNSVQSLPREVDPAEQADQTFREMLVAIFREYDFEPRDPWDGEIPMDEDSFPAVTLVGRGTIKIHGWDYRLCYGFPNGKAIYWPLMDIPLRYNPDLRKLVATTKDIAQALADHTACLEGNVYFNLVHRTSTMVHLMPFAAIDSNQVLRVNENFWAELTVGEIEGDIPALQDIKILLEIRILAAFKSIPPAPSGLIASVPRAGPSPTEDLTADVSTPEQDKASSTGRAIVAPTATKARTRKAPIKYRELYLEWLRKTKWEFKPKTSEIRKLGKYGRVQLPALLGLVNFVAEMIKDASFTDHRADPLIRYNIVSLGVFADFLNHGEDWIKGCLHIKRKLPLCAELPAMIQSIRKAARHGLGVSSVVEAINSALGTSRKRKRSEPEEVDDDGDDRDNGGDNGEDRGGIADEETIRGLLITMEGEDWVQDDDESEEEFPEWLGLTI